MVTPSSKELFIMGMTHAGKTFRPSDWAERLAGVMSQFRPGGACAGSHLSYSPWCVPTVMNGTKCVVINRDLRDYEPMAWDFCLNFAKDNDLQVAEACLLPDKLPAARSDFSGAKRRRANDKGFHGKLFCICALRA